MQSFWNEILFMDSRRSPLFDFSRKQLGLTQPMDCLEIRIKEIMKDAKKW